ncbi:tyrosine-type recombinase/integrase [Crossiella sp. CA-258035]|uniref:tyrosine-type recombinase/integrase n=1 Tax=Crossiella sp. CA-258035 TaxID=2981138 RepID=UPI0024BBF5A7|nr:tyrosine-type recombinase/integrase [Crossiella sp. CA-258035]WHT20185.1 tyrosine-type recombinase/integrase [Crossiella sp. CA-258035]
MSAEIEAARLLLARLGVSPEQLLAAPTTDTPMPLIRDYLARVANAVSPSTREAYGPYWRRIAEAWGERPLDQLTALELKQLAEHTRHEAVVRKNSRGGRSAAEHLVSAARCLYRHAVNDGLIREWDNPAMRVAKPRRLASTRRALPADRLAEINKTAGSTGNDPELDLTVLRLHTETACRRGGALALRPKDLDPQQCLIRLREKGLTVRWQPVSPTMMDTLVAHGQQRGADPDGQLLRYRNGKPITTRRYDHFWLRMGKHLPWVATQQVTTHWIRHTTLTYVERNFGYGIARAFAGHFGKSDAGTTTTYIQAELHEVATALAALTGEPHPLAQPPG